MQAVDRERRLVIVLKTPAPTFIFRCLQISVYSKKQKTLEEVTLNENKSGLHSLVLSTEAENQLTPLTAHKILTFLSRCMCCCNSIYHIDSSSLEHPCTEEKGCCSCSPDPSNRASTNQPFALLTALREVFAFLESRPNPESEKVVSMLLNLPFRD